MIRKNAVKITGFVTVGMLFVVACSSSSPTSVPVQSVSTPTLPTNTLPPPTASPLPTASATEEVIELNPSPRGHVSMAYDSESKQVILFGGQTGDFNKQDIPFSGPTMDFANPGIFSDETWAYDVTTNIWKEMKPPLAPDAGAAGSLVYDVESDRVILFGTTRGHSPFVETWAYDFNTNTWTKMVATGPSTHLGSNMAYDIESDRIILFGGYNHYRDEMYQDTWTYDFNSDTWTWMKPVTSPPGQNFHSMTYNIKVNRVILWGGDTEVDMARPPKDPSVWAYDFNANTWEQKKTSDGPSARAFSAIAYDTASDQIILYGGYTIGSHEMWAYDLSKNAWQKLDSSINPGDLSRHAFSYIPDTDRFILFGGQLGSTHYNYTQSTWVYDFNTNTWTDVTRQP